MKNIKLKLKETKAIYRKGIEIKELVEEIIDLIPEEKEMQLLIGKQLSESATNILLKIMCSDVGVLYDMKMENAVIVRYYANCVLSAASMLGEYEYEYKEYLPMIKEKMEEFRALFKVWVASFDPKLALEDEWGLFNPPGIDLKSIDEDDIFVKLVQQDHEEE
jgi:hypothetical protein